MKKEYLIGKFWNPDHVMAALRQLKDKGIPVEDVFSPFPMHGIEPLLGIKRTRLLTASFIYGALGLLTAIACITIIYGVVWPMNIGGKPALPVPDYVPIAFEMTVLFSAHGTVLTFFVVSNYWPGKRTFLFDDRQTDDVIVIAIDKGTMPVNSTDNATQILNGAGAFAVESQNV